LIYPLTQQQIPTQFDVIVVGAGAAGLYTALCLPQNLSVGLISKQTLTLSASDWAQGGIAAAVSTDDSPLLHIEDTLKAGAGLCDIDAVKFLTENAKASIDSLVDLGVAFDRDNGQLALTLEAAHSRNRVLHAADTTGREVTTTLTKQVLRRQNIQVIQQALALNLWIDDRNHRCQGICLFYQNKIQWVKAGAVVLATGGGGQVFSQTTNPAISTGDGVAIAWRVGAILRDLEFFQFHPTALSKTAADRFLISEAVRGEGAHLIDSNGKRFAFDYHPSGELAPRDVVSRAIFSHLQNTSLQNLDHDKAIAAEEDCDANVWLDMRPIPPDKILHRFPNIIKVCQNWGIDAFTTPIPVSPAAHYWMGGIFTDTANRTNIPGLYAVGETTSTGVHGANRLASNSLLECIVFGAQMAQLQLPENWINSITDAPSKQEFNLTLEEWDKQLVEIGAIRLELPRLMWQSAGICREKESLETALTIVKSWQKFFAELSLTQFLLNLSPHQFVTFSFPDTPQKLQLWAETRNLLDIAYLILNSASFREESRGGHYRLDYPESEIKWLVHTMVQYNNWWKSS
jgi:L-aspartate oxidase